MTLHDRPFTRRTVVAGAGIAAAAAAVGCSSPESDTVKKSAAAPPPVVHRKPAPILGDGIPDPEGQPIASCTDIPVGSGIIKDGTIITQPVEDTFYGFSNVCTHSGCQITQIIKDKIKCTCHGSEFSLTGDVENGPAKKALNQCTIVMANETIFKQA